MERDAATSGGTNGLSQGQELQQAASGLMEQAARTADAQASTTMTTVGQTLETVASHIRQAGEELRQSQPQVAGFIDTAADQVQGAATYLRERDASEALENIQRIARNQPALVIGGGLAAGLIIGRILRGGAETATSGQSNMAYDRSGGYGQTGSGYGYESGYGVDGGYGAGSGYTPMGPGRATSATDPTLAGTIGTVGDDDLLREDMQRDSATGDAVRDEAPTSRS